MPVFNKPADPPSFQGPLADRLNAMSEDEFEDELKAIQKAIRERDQSPEPKYSRKTKHINLVDPKNQEMLHRVSLRELEMRSDQFTQRSMGPGERNGC